MLNAKRGDLEQADRAAAGAAAADGVVAERSRLGRHQYHPRGENGARPDPAIEAGRRPGHCRVPAEQDCRVMRIVASSNTTAPWRRLLSATRVRDRATESRARQIVTGVRDGGDAALRRFASRLDGLTGSIEVARRTWEREARQLPTAVRAAIASAARHIRSVSRRQVPKGWRHTVAAGHHRRAARRATVARRVLRARRTVSPSLFTVDDRDPGARRGRPRSRRVLSQAGCVGLRRRN